MKRRTLLISALILCMVAEVTKADFTFGKPTNLGPTVNSLTDDYFPNISVDGLTLYFHSRRPGSYGPYDLWAATRRTTDGQWDEPVNLGPVVNSSVQDGGASISADDLSLYFHSLRSGVADLWVTTRATVGDAWREPVNLGPVVNSSESDVCPRISADGLSLFFESTRAGGFGGRDLWVTARTTLEDAWGAPVNLGPNVNTPAGEVGLDLSADGLTLIFSSNRPDGSGDYDMWMTTRATVSGLWGPAVNLGQAINTTYGESAPSISADGFSLYFCDYNFAQPGGSGGIDMWQVPIVPVVDLNSDGIADLDDMYIMLEHWGTSDSLCDIGPTLFGDGIVDAHDLIVLAKHMLENSPVAHWKLNEIEGDTAHDSAGKNNASVHGGALWQPTGGMFGGALQLDGVDDWLFTGPVKNLGAGPMSVLTWIKGGSPNQAVMSQSMNSNWLAANDEGKLTTELGGSGQPGERLVSETVITDGDWHRIGVVLDGLHRRLYVDGVAVAEESQDGSGISASGLNIGVGKNYLPGTYWSGMIDDVRIYDKALTPEQVAALAQ